MPGGTGRRSALIVQIDAAANHVKKSAEINVLEGCEMQSASARTQNLVPRDPGAFSIRPIAASIGCPRLCRGGFDRLLLLGRSDRSLGGDFVDMFRHFEVSELMFA